MSDKLNLENVRDNEGELLYYEGIFKCMEEKEAFSTHQLLLSDGTAIILNLGSFVDSNEVFTKAMNKKCIRIQGRIYIGTIPEEYKIIARTTNPYMVDIRHAEPYE